MRRNHDPISASSPYDDLGGSKRSPDGVERNPGCSKPNFPDYGCACIRATLANHPMPG
ncbi:TPA: hypothetical protein I8Y90_001276 [Legionella pneumophila]|nr:hypothetical protein [Legionella pneumophila]